MKILVITTEYYPTSGGVISVIKNTSEELSSLGHECTVLSVCEKIDDEELINKVKVVRHKSPSSKLLLGYPIGLKKLLLNTNYHNMDIIHIHGYHSLLSYRSLILLKRNNNVVFSPHYHAIGHTKIKNVLHYFYKLLWKNIINVPINVICCSKYESELIKNNFLINQNKIILVPHGVNKIQVIQKKVNSTISLLYVGYVREYKGIHFIIQAVRKLTDLGYAVHLRIIGDGEYKDKIKELIEKYNLNSNIIWEKNLSEQMLEKRYQEADILLLLSRAEAYGLVVAEALANGTPCIVAKSAALNEFTSQQGCFGVDYPPSIDELVNIILFIKNKSVTISQINKDKIRTWDFVAKEYESIYMRVLERFGD